MNQIDKKRGPGQPKKVNPLSAHVGFRVTKQEKATITEWLKDNKTTARKVLLSRIKGEME